MAVPPVNLVAIALRLPICTLEDVCVLAASVVEDFALITSFSRPRIPKCVATSFMNSITELFDAGFEKRVRDRNARKEW